MLPCMTQQEQFVPDPEVGRLYDEEGLTVQQVADRLGMSTYFATKHLKALDVPIRGAAPEAPFVPDPEVARLYKGEALNVGEVGARLDMSSHLVRKHLKALKVPMRRGPATPDLPWDEIAEEYKDGASTVQLGE